ncbi:hypothetical protein GCM10027258_39880 [Amycolatopsis stemonae]
MPDEPMSDERSRAIRTVKRHAHGSADEAVLLAMLGLDHAEPAPRAHHHRPAAALSPAEVRELLAPLAAQRAGAR